MISNGLPRGWWMMSSYLRAADAGMLWVCKRALPNHSSTLEDWFLASNLRACGRAQSPRAAHGLHAHTACAIGGWSRGPRRNSGEGCVKRQLTQGCGTATRDMRGILLGFTRYTTSAYTIPRCWAPHTQTQMCDTDLETLASSPSLGGMCALGRSRVAALSL